MKSSMLEKFYALLVLGSLLATMAIVGLLLVGSGFPYLVPQLG